MRVGGAELAGDVGALGRGRRAFEVVDAKPPGPVEIPSALQGFDAADVEWLWKLRSPGGFF